MRPVVFHSAGPLTDPYGNDVCRQLSVAGASSSDVIASLRSMNLGDDFWMYSFKVRPISDAIQARGALLIRQPL
jgi:hypothetical protein